MLGTTRFGLASLFALSLVSCASSSATHPRCAIDDLAVRAVAAALPLPMPPPKLSSGSSPATFDLGLRVVGAENPNIAPVDDKHDPFPCNCCELRI
jgi:hypothetical protein